MTDTPKTETTKAKFGNWDADFKKKEASSATTTDKGKIEYMNISKEGKYVVRLIGPYVTCHKHIKVPYNATLQWEDKANDPAWQAGFYPKKRFAIHVIDRADGKLKILEKGSSIFEYFHNYKETFGKDPSKKEGPDFQIKVEVPIDPKTKKPVVFNTKYTVTHLQDAPLTEAEIEMYKTSRWKLEDIYRSTTPAKLKEMWDALPAEAKIAPKQKKFGDNTPDAPAKSEASKPATPIKETMPEAPADKDDLFEAKDEEPEEQKPGVDGADVF